MHPSDPFKESIIKSQFFEIDVRKDNIAEGAGGTLINIPQGAFIHEEGNVVNGAIKFELAEALSTSDMLLSNVTTTSNKKPLQSGGMIYFNVTDNGKVS